MINLRRHSGEETVFDPAATLLQNSDLYLLRMNALFSQWGANGVRKFMDDQTNEHPSLRLESESELLNCV